MPRTCSVCNHILREEIDKALLAGQSLRDIAGRFSVAKSAVQRHRQHISAALATARHSEEITRGEDLLAQLRELTVEAIRLKEKAESKKDYRTALAAVRELCRIVELVAKLRGELSEQAEIRLVNFQLDAETARRIGETFLARHQSREISS